MNLSNNRVFIGIAFNSDVCLLCSNTSFSLSCSCSMSTIVISACTRIAESIKLRTGFTTRDKRFLKAVPQHLKQSLFVLLPALSAVLGSQFVLKSRCVSCLLLESTFFSRGQSLVLVVWTLANVYTLCQFPRLPYACPALYPLTGAACNTSGVHRVKVPLLCVRNI